MTQHEEKPQLEAHVEVVTATPHSSSYFYSSSSDHHHSHHHRHHAHRPHEDEKADPFPVLTALLIGKNENRGASLPTTETFDSVCRSVLPAAGRSSLTQTLQYVNQSVCSAFVSRYLGVEKLGPFAIGITVFNFLGVSLLVGASTTLETLAGEEFGKDPLGPGVAKQAEFCFFALLLTCVPMSFFFMTCRPLLDLAFPSELVPDVELFLRVAPIYLVAFCGRAVLNRLCLVTRRSEVSLYGMLLAVAMYPLFGWLLVPAYGIPGAVMSLALSTSTHVGAMLLLLYYTDSPVDGSKSFVHHLSLGHFSGPGSILNSRRLSQFATLAIPSAIALVVSWWVSEVFTLLGANLRPDTRAGAPSVHHYVSALAIINLSTMICLVTPIGASAVTASTISARQGENRPGCAFVIAKVCTFFAVVVAFTTAVFVIVFGDLWFRLFTDDETVLSIVSPLRFLIALFSICEAVPQMLFGIFRGLGQQPLLLRISASVMWIVAVPLMWVLGIYLDYKLAGLLWAFVIGLGLQIPILAYFAYYKFDYVLLAKETHDRMEKLKKAKKGAAATEGAATITAPAPNGVMSTSTSAPSSANQEQDHSAIAIASVEREEKDASDKKIPIVQYEEVKDVVAVEKAPAAPATATE